MAKEKQEKQDPNKVKVQEEAIEKMLAYFRLGRLLFGSGEKSPYDINELKEDNEFYKPAKDLAQELEIDWKNMTHEESNRIMLSLLDDYFNSINVNDEYEFILSVTINPKKKG